MTVSAGDPTPVVVLASACSATDIVVNALRREGIDPAVVLERPVSPWRVARRRAKRLGVVTACGQVLFRLLAVPVLERAGRARNAEIAEQHGLDLRPARPDFEVRSANDPAARAVLRALRPSIVVVVGTRILAPTTLRCVDAPFVNLHAGITPRYRGVHGGYWALVEGRADLAGSTVHLVDPGIDTGQVLAQATFAVTERDSFATYPSLHVAVGVPLLVDSVRRVLSGGDLAPSSGIECGQSKLRYHPTLWGYVSTRRRLSVN